MKLRLIIIALLVVNAGLLAMFFLKGKSAPTPVASAEGEAAWDAQPLPGQDPRLTALEPGGSVEDNEQMTAEEDSLANDAPEPDASRAVQERPNVTPRRDPVRIESKPAPRTETGQPRVEPVLTAADAPTSGSRLPSGRDRFVPDVVEIAGGTPIMVRTSSAVNSRDYRSGDTFALKLAEDVFVDGHLALKAGSEAIGFFHAIKESGRVKGLEEVEFSLTEVIGPTGQSQKIRTNRMQLTAEKTTKRDATRVAGGAAIGAIIGGIAKGGKGAATGAATGGAAGAGLVLGTRGKPVTIEADTLFEFTLDEPVTLRIRERGDR